MPVSNLHVVPPQPAVSSRQGWRELTHPKDDSLHGGAGRGDDAGNGRCHPAPEVQVEAVLGHPPAAREPGPHRIAGSGPFHGARLRVARPRPHRCAHRRDRGASGRRPSPARFPRAHGGQRACGPRRRRRGADRVRARHPGDRGRLRIDRGPHERHQHGRRGDRPLRHARAGSALLPCPRRRRCLARQLRPERAGRRERPGGDEVDGAPRWRRVGPRRRQAVDHRRLGGRRLRRLGPHGAGRNRTRGLSCFLVPGGAPGLRAGRPEDKMGIRASATVPLELSGCRVPSDALLGRENEGFKIAMAALDGGRIGIACQAIGIARAALDESVRYAKDRKTFGVAISEHQAIQWKLADMKTSIDAAHLLAMRAAWLKLRRGNPSRRRRPWPRSSRARRPSGSATTPCRSTAAMGTSGRLPAERHLRDARVTAIYEGTSEIQLLRHRPAACLARAPLRATSVPQREKRIALGDNVRISLRDPPSLSGIRGSHPGSPRVHRGERPLSLAEASSSLQCQAQSARG